MDWLFFKFISEGIEIFSKYRSHTQQARVYARESAKSRASMLLTVKYVYTCFPYTGFFAKHKITFVVQSEVTIITTLFCLSQPVPATSLYGE